MRNKRKKQEGIRIEFILEDVYYAKSLENPSFKTIMPSQFHNGNGMFIESFLTREIMSQIGSNVSDYIENDIEDGILYCVGNYYDRDSKGVFQVVLLSETSLEDRDDNYYLVRKRIQI